MNVHLRFLLTDRQDERRLVMAVLDVCGLSVIPEMTGRLHPDFLPDG